MADYETERGDWQRDDQHLESSDSYQRSSGARRDGTDAEAEKFRKLFIGGLCYETTDETLRTFFEKWGEVVDCIVMKDPQTRRSRGFGFVTYLTSAMVDEAQAHRPHRIDGREVETKRAMPRDSEPQDSVTKMFLGGLKMDTTEDEVREALKDYGDIESVELMKDRETGKLRGFGFVTFRDADQVDKCVLHKSFKICGRYVEVKKALSRKELQSGGGNAGGRGRNQGRGGNRYGGNNVGPGGDGNFRGNFNNQGGNFGGNYGNQGGNFQGGGNFGNQGGNFGGNQGGNFGGNQGGNFGGNFGNNQGGNFGGNQGGNYGGNYGGNQGGNYGGNYGGNQGNYGGGNYGGGNYGGGNYGNQGGNFGGQGSGNQGGNYGGGNYGNQNGGNYQASNYGSGNQGNYGGNYNQGGQGGGNWQGQGADNLGQNYGSGYGGGPIKSSSHTSRNQGPYSTGGGV